MSARGRSSSFYGADLAHVHHAGFRSVAEGAAQWLARDLAERPAPAGPVLDLACGSGVFAAAIARRTGRSVLGIDSSAAMIALARRTAPGARFRAGSIHEGDLPPAAIVTVIGEGLSYVPATGKLPSLATTFRRVRSCLPPGGLFVFDLVTGPLATLAPGHGFRTGPDWAVLVETRRVGQDHLERGITVFRKVRASYRRSEERHMLRVTPRDAVLGRLRSAGFTVRTRTAHDPAEPLPGRTVFVARKRR